jgi:hypothetical protein
MTNKKPKNPTHTPDKNVARRLTDDMDRIEAEDTITAFLQIMINWAFACIATELQKGQPLNPLALDIVVPLLRATPNMMYNQQPNQYSPQPLIPLDDDDNIDLTHSVYTNNAPSFVSSRLTRSISYKDPVSLQSITIEVPVTPLNENDNPSIPEANAAVSLGNGSSLIISSTATIEVADEDLHTPPQSPPTTPLHLDNNPLLNAPRRPRRPDRDDESDDDYTPAPPQLPFDDSDDNQEIEVSPIPLAPAAFSLDPHTTSPSAEDRDEYDSESESEEDYTLDPVRGPNMFDDSDDDLPGQHNSHNDGNGSVN